MFKIPFLLKWAAMSATFHGLALWMSTSSGSAVVRLRQGVACQGPDGVSTQQCWPQPSPLWHLSQVQFHVGLSDDLIVLLLPRQIRSLGTGSGFCSALYLQHIDENQSQHWPSVNICLTGEWMNGVIIVLQNAQCSWPSKSISSKEEKGTGTQITVCCP